MSFRRIALILRATPLLGFLPAGALAVTMGIVAGQQPDIEHRYLPTRLGILAIVIAAGFVFDDPATPMSDPLPSPLRWRRLVRASVPMLISSILFTLVLLFAADDMELVVTFDSSMILATQSPPLGVQKAKHWLKYSSQKPEQDWSSLPQDSPSSAREQHEPS